MRLSVQSKVSPETIRRVELGDPRLTPGPLAAIRAALEAAGVIFVDENGEGPGVRLKKPQP